MVDLFVGDGRVRSAVVEDDLVLRVSMVDNGHAPRLVHLEGLHRRECEVRRDLRGGQRRDFVRRALHTEPRPQRWADIDARSQICLRPASFQPLNSDGTAPLRISVAPLLDRMVSLGPPQNFGGSFVSEADLRVWAVTAGTVLMAAARNVTLDARHVDDELLARGVLSVSHLTNDVTPMIIQAVVAARRLIGTDLVVVAPSWRQFRVVSVDDGDPVAAIDWAFETYRETSLRLSPVPYRLQPERIDVWHPASLRAAEPLVARAQRVLEAVHDREGRHGVRNCTVRADSVIEIWSQDEAQRLDSPIVRPEHLMLGLLAEGDAVAARALRDGGLTLDIARRICGNISPDSPRDRGREPIPAPETLVVVAQAQQEALALGHNYIATEHLLLALLTEGGDVVAALLGCASQAGQRRWRQRVLQLLS